MGRPRNDLSRRIRDLREAREMTQEQLAAAIVARVKKRSGRIVHLSKYAVSKWELGAAPRAKLLPDVAAALDVSVGELYGEAA